MKTKNKIKHQKQCIEPRPNPDGYQAAKFLWAVEKLVPNHPHILKIARQVVQKDRIDDWRMDAIMFVDDYEDDYGKVVRAKPNGNTVNLRWAHVSDHVSIFLGTDDDFLQSIHPPLH